MCIEKYYTQEAGQKGGQKQSGNMSRHKFKTKQMKCPKKDKRGRT